MLYYYIDIKNFYLEKEKRDPKLVFHSNVKWLVNLSIPSETLKSMYIDFGCEKIDGYRKRHKVPLGMDENDYLAYLENQDPFEIDEKALYEEAIKDLFI